jgi:type IV pilus assembly protein PilW
MKYPNRQVRSHSGFGIIEIMIALLLGIIIMLGVSEVATNNSKTRWEIERVGRQIDNASYALRVLEADLVNAAFWGESRNMDAGTQPPICLDDGIGGTVAVASAMEYAEGYPIQGGHIYDAPYNVDPYDKIQCPPAAEDLVPKAGTDYIAIRRASSCAVGTTDCAAFGSNFHLQVNACFKEESPQDTERTRVSDNEAVLDDGTYTDRDCSTIAPKYRFMNRIYYVNEQDQLVRAELVGDGYPEPTVLVDDVEMLRFEYGLDTDGDGREDLPADANNPYPAEPDVETNGADAAEVARWADVVRVTINLVVRSPDPSLGFLDKKIYDLARLKYDYSSVPAAKSVDAEAPATYCAHLPPRAACDVTIPAQYANYRRQLYSRTIGLRNVAGRRE